MATALDPRLHAFRPDLADAGLAGRVEAARFVEAEPGHIIVPVADIRRRPQGVIDSQLLLGEAVRIFERADGWAWIQSEFDGYVGYVALEALAGGTVEPTHLVTAPRTFLYPEAELRTPPLAALSIGSRVAIRDFVERRGTRYGALAAGGFIFAGHVARVGTIIADPVAVAESLLGTPYLWGGASAFGLDCSGLVQLALRMAGRKVPRDSDMQQEAVGKALAPDAQFRRGDLAFWEGHVAIFSDPASLIHANGMTMQVSREPLAVALARIGAVYGPPLVCRRP